MGDLHISHLLYLTASYSYRISPRTSKKPVVRLGFVVRCFKANYIEANTLQLSQGISWLRAVSSGALIVTPTLLMVATMGRPPAGPLPGRRLLVAEDAGR